jgi:hypothetical protein
LVSGGRLGELRVEPVQKARQEGVAGLERIDPFESQLLHQPVLQRLVHPLDAPLGLGTVGVEDVDVQLVQGAAELRETGAAGGTGLVDAEDRVLVAVEGHRLAVVLQVAASRVEVVEGRLRIDETQLHEPPGGVVHVDQERALRPAALEPGVLGAVDLHQFTEAVAPVPRLMAMLGPLLAASPEARLHPPEPERFPRQLQLMLLGQLLGDQGRAEVHIVLAHEAEDPGLHRIAIRVIAPTTAALGHQCGRAVALERVDQPTDVPRRKPQLLGRIDLRQAPVAHALDDGESVQFCRTHGEQIRWSHGGHLEAKSSSLRGCRMLGNRTFLLCTNRTSLYCAYTPCAYTTQLRSLVCHLSAHKEMAVGKRMRQMWCAGLHPRSLRTRICPRTTCFRLIGVFGSTESRPVLPVIRRPMKIHDGEDQDVSGVLVVEHAVREAFDE